MTDEKTQQLENRIDKLESTIEKMMPSRRDALKMGGAALVGGAAISGNASAGSNQVGTIGSQASPVDLESEDINNADTVTTDTLDSTTIDNSSTVTTQDLVVNGTATGPFGGGGIVFEEGDPIQEFTDNFFRASGDSFFTIFNLSNPVDIYGGSVYGANLNKIRVTFGTNNTTTIQGGSGSGAKGIIGGDGITVLTIFPMKSVKKLEAFNESGGQVSYGFQVYTT
jgi:hypothetical protein